MDSETLELLEYDQIIEIIAGFTQSHLGRQEIRAITPHLDQDKISRLHRAISDTLVFLQENPRFGCSHLEDLDPIIPVLKIGSRRLEAPELLAILDYLDSLEALKRMIRAGNLLFVENGLKKITIPPQVKQSITTAVGPHGEILDSAHPELAHIRKRQESLRKKLNRQLERLFKSHRKHLISDPFVTQRAGRFVIPVRTENQQFVPGIVHGSSSSGATVFIEPLSSVELNNEWVQSIERESELIRTVLNLLTDEIRNYADDLKSLSAIFGCLDASFACADFYRHFRCSIPHLTTELEFRIEEAYHPLLLKNLGRKSVVPIDIQLDQETRVLVISGPNTGGKTAALKTAGLLALMALSGLPVPAREATFPVLKGVFADIGDHQSITEQLSTFSAHIKRINTLVDSADSPCLLLLDELGRGTDPIYGSVIAVATIDHFHTHRCLILTSTHHRLVKSFADSTSGVQNASVQLDPTTHHPTYRIEPNSIGQSSGLEIAAQIGLSASIISRAKGLLDQKELEVEKYLEALKEEFRQLKLKEDDLNKKFRELEQNETRRELESLEKERKREEVFEAHLKQWGREFDRESKRLLKRIKDRLNAAETRRKLKQRREQLKEEFRKKSKAGIPAQEQHHEGVSFKAGETVYHSFFRKRGSVISSTAHQVIIDIDGKRITAKPEDLSKIHTRDVTRSPSRQVTVQVVESTEPELNLIGKTVEEALPMIDKFLDRAFLSELREITVIHGFGTGKLKSSLGDFLENHPLVDHFEVEGGSTRVFLRD